MIHVFYGEHGKWSGTEGRHREEFISPPRNLRNDDCPRPCCNGVLVHLTESEDCTFVQCNECGRFFSRSLIRAIHRQ